MYFENVAQPVSNFISGGAGDSFNRKFKQAL